MSAPLKSDLEFERWERQSAGESRAVASASMVNRTHRVVRERAVSLQQRKSKIRSLWFPLAVSGGLLSLVCFAVWSIFEQSDVTQNDAISTGLPDASNQMFVFLLWCLPVTAAVLTVVWSKLNRQTRDESAR